MGRTWAAHTEIRERETRGETSRHRPLLATRLALAGWATWGPPATSTPSCRLFTSPQSSEVSTEQLSSLFSFFFSVTKFYYELLVLCIHHVFYLWPRRITVSSWCGGTGGVQRKRRSWQFSGSFSVGNTAIMATVCVYYSGNTAIMATVCVYYTSGIGSC